MKKFISAAVAAAMLAGLLPMTGMASAVSASTLDTTANQNLVSGGASLLDDTYQYSAYGDSYYAYLWVPGNAAYLNGVMIAKSNLIEAQLMQSKTVRDTLAKYNIGVVYLHERNTVEHTNATGYMGDFDYTETGNTGAELDELMARLAAASGYDELRWTPFIGVGHSAGMGLGRAIASWDPSRVIAQVCLKGGTNLSNPGHKSSGNLYDIQPGVPTYIDAGQFTEHAGYDNPAGKDNYIDGDIPKLPQIRANGTDRLVTMSVEWEAGHYDWTETSNGMLAAYLDTIIPLRLGGSNVQLAENYVLTDLTDTGYVSDIKMFGTRTTEYAESEYSHGAVSSFSETEQKSMVWFPTEELYNTIRSYTADRKDLPTDVYDDEETGVADPVTVYPTVEQQFDSSTGEKLAGNYVRYDKSIMFKFDTNSVDNGYTIDSAILAFNVYWGNTSRNLKITQYNEAQTGSSIAIPSGSNSTVINAAAGSITNASIDVTSAVKKAIKNGDSAVYFAVSITDDEKTAYDAAVAAGSFTSGTYNYPYNGSDMYFNSLEREGKTADNVPRLTVTYKTDNSTIYPSLDKAFNEANGNPNWWQGDLHYIQVTGSLVFYDILLGFDMSKADDTKTIDTAKLSVTRTGGAGGITTNVYKLSQSPWAGGSYDSSVVTAITDSDLVTSYDGNTAQIDVTNAVKNETGMVYFVLRYADRTKEQSGNDYYSDSVVGTSYNAVAQQDSDRPQLMLTYAEDDAPTSEPTAAPVKTKHQYLQLEDPSTKTPKAFTRITRYDMVNPNDSSYADGLSDDPMTFSMYVDKMNVVSPDHIGAGSKIRATSDTPAVLTPVMAPVEWVGAVQETLTSDDIANNVSSKWRNVLRWKNNRVYYRAIFQDSYINLNTFDVYDGDDLKFAYATNTFQISPPYITGGTEQHITVGDIADVNKGFSSFTISPLSSAGLTVDTMVEYGPVKATLNSNGTYTITPDQIPVGAQYPIECKLVFTQFGVNNNGTKINTAAPVEKVFYITDGSTLSVPTSGSINAAALKAAGVTGFNVEGSGTITLGMDTDTAFTALRAVAISAERAGSSDTEYQKHYQYPSGYDPHDHWNLYPATWTASGSGFIPLSQFTNTDGEMLNLDFINTISTSGITAITPVTAQTEVYRLTAASYGAGAKLSWAEPIGNAFDSVKVYVDGVEKAVLLSGDTYAVVTGLEDGSHAFKVTTVKGGIESAGAETSAVIDATKYLVEDFETGSLNRVLSGQVNQPVYNAMSQTGAALSLLGSDEKHLGMQNNYTSTVQTVDIEIPGGIAKEMTALTVDIKVDKLEDTYSSGQVYFELYNPTTGKSYGIEKGSDFALTDKDWHEGYSIPLSSFNLPSSETALAQITVLKIGRKVVGGGNNNRRGKIYLDNIGFTAEEPIKTKKLTLSYDNIVGKDGTLPNGFTTTDTNVNYLFDGDTTSTNLYISSKQKRLYIDLGKEYKISKIVVYDYTSKGTLMVAGGTTNPATLSSHDAGFKTMLRTNGSTQNGVASSYEDITGGRVATANDIYTVSAFESVRYISFFDWSNAVSVAELEIYVVDEDEPVVIAPTATLAQIYTSEGKENVTGEATAWSLTVTPGTYSGKLILGVEGAETIKQSDTVLTAGQGGVVFGILVNKVVSSDVFSATLGGTEITIE